MVVVVRYLTKKYPFRFTLFRGKNIPLSLCSSAFGCADPQVPEDGLINRQGDRAVITCESSAEEWEIICRDDQWHGDFRECSESKHTSTCPEYVKSVCLAFTIF